MTDPFLVHAKPATGSPGVLPPLAEVIAAQPLAAAIVAFLLLYALLTLMLRLADRVDPPPERLRPNRSVNPSPTRVWRFRKAA